MKRASLRQLIKRVGMLLLTFISLGSTVVFACSGNATLVLIEHNRSVVRLYAFISMACLLASIVLFFLRQRKGLWVIVINIFLLVYHPLWIYGGGGGDCGRSRASGAMFSSVLVAVGVAYQLRAWLIARH